MMAIWHKAKKTDTVALPSNNHTIGLRRTKKTFCLKVTTRFLWFAL